MPLEDEIAEEMAKEIQKEIDGEIMSDILKTIGYVAVEFYFDNNQHANDVNFWLLENCNGTYRRVSKYFMFEDKKDAEWFILRWS